MSMRLPIWHSRRLVTAAVSAALLTIFAATAAFAATTSAVPTASTPARGDSAAITSDVSEIASADRSMGSDARSGVSDAQQRGTTATSPDACSQGTVLHLEIARFPQGNMHGAATPELAARGLGVVGSLTLLPMGKQASAPVWITAGEQTFVATILPDGTWFASPARVVGCDSPPPRVAPAAGSGPRG